MRNVTWAGKPAAWSESGQATVEVLVVGLVILCFALVLGALWKEFDIGTFSEHISAGASHTTGAGIVAAVGDIAFF